MGSIEHDHIEVYLGIYFYKCLCQREGPIYTLPIKSEMNSLYLVANRTFRLFPLLDRRAIYLERFLLPPLGVILCHSLVSHLAPRGRLLFLSGHVNLKQGYSPPQSCFCESYSVNLWPNLSIRYRRHGSVINAEERELTISHGEKISSHSHRISRVKVD